MSLPLCTRTCSCTLGRTQNASCHPCMKTFQWRLTRRLTRCRSMPWTTSGQHVVHWSPVVCSLCCKGHQAIASVHSQYSQVWLVTSALVSPPCCVKRVDYCWCCRVPQLNNQHGGHPRYICSCTLTNAFHRMRGLHVWRFLYFLLPATCPAIHRLLRICLHFWRVDAVNRRACHGWRKSPQNHAVHSTILR